MFPSYTPNWSFIISPWYDISSEKQPQHCTALYKLTKTPPSLSLLIPHVLQQLSILSTPTRKMNLVKFEEELTGNTQTNIH